VSKPAKPITAWAITTGETGMRTQARGLAAAVADIVVEKTVRTGLGSIGRGGDRLEPPWPDLVISCGRRAATSTLAVGKASGGRALMVHVQDPRARADRFDLIVAMDHDAIAPGGQVIKVATALHDLTSDNLAEAGQAWSARLAPLGSPLVGVIIGGTLRGRPFTLADGRVLLAGLRRLRDEGGAALAITPSRRTPDTVRALFAQAFAGDERVFLWNMEGDNPYRGILALADRLVVTSDSVSMVSEALSTAHPVEIFDLGFPRHAAFIQGLIDKGFARRFTGDPSPPPMAGPVNATLQAAEAVRILLQARTGVAG
jgi:mitochondrial fission protein ELM1